MGRLATCVLLLALSSSARGDAALDAAVRALRDDGSLKVRAQAAIVLGHRRDPEAVRALADALAGDPAAAVRIAAATALARIGDGAARAALDRSAAEDRDASVRAAAVRALAELSPAFVVEQASGADEATRAALRDAIARHLRSRGWSIVDRGGIRLKPSVLRVDVDARGGRTVIAVKASLVAVEGDGRMAAMLESGARLSAAGAVPDGKLGAYAAKALDAAARALCDDLASRLGRR